MANLIPGDILAMLLELYAKPLVGGAVQTGAEAFDNLPRKHLVTCQLGEIARSKEFRYLGHPVLRITFVLCSLKALR